MGRHARWFNRNFQVPVFIGAGRADHVTDAELAHQYFERIAAPQKDFLWFERSGHSPHLEEPDKFNNWIIEEIRPAALATEASGAKTPAMSTKNAESAKP